LYIPATAASAWVPAASFANGGTMYQLIHSLTASDLFKRQLPVFLVAFLIAEFFYKFKSFALEAIAFLVTWYVLDAIVSFLMPRKAPTTTTT
jgi:hypothetical protein